MKPKTQFISISPHVTPTYAPFRSALVSVLRSMLVMCLLVATSSLLVLTHAGAVHAAPAAAILACDPGTVVLNIDDIGCGSLRQTVADAPANSTVTFSPTLAGQTIILPYLAIEVTKTVTIDGSAAPTITVSGDENSNIFITDPGTVVTLTRINMVDGKTSGFGGAVNAGGDLVLIGTRMTNNVASFNGGAVAMNGSLIVSGSTFISNTAGDKGGALSIAGPLRVTRSVFVGNTAAQGGAVSYVGTDGQFVNSLFARNTAGTNGDAIFVESAGDVQLIHNTIASPTLTLGAAVYVSLGNVALTNTLITSHTTAVENISGTVSAAYDLFFGNTITLSTTPSGTITSNNLITTCNEPYFVNPDGDNYRLLNGSAAINSGTSAGVSVDIDGSVRPINGAFDMGYHETNALDRALCNLTATNSSTNLFGVPTQFTATLVAGSNVAYTWSFGDGSTGSGATPTHTYTSVGGFTAIVTATNSVPGSGGILSATTSVTIVDAAITGLNAVSNSPKDLGSATQFTASVTAGTNVVYTWSFGDGSTGSGATPAHTYASIGSYTATVTATNSLGNASTSIGVKVNDVAITGLSAANDGPTVLGNSTDLTATIATGTNVVYAWSFGDGITGTGPIPSHAYASTGVYAAVVTATNATNTVTAMTSVVVTNAAPIANAGPDQNVFVSTTVQLNGSGSSDPDNHLPLQYRWLQTGGTSVTLISDTAALPLFTAPSTPAVLTFTLRVTDALGLAAVSSDSVVITVSNAAISGLSAVNDSPTVLSNTTRFTASISTGTNVAFVWNFGDGQLGSGATPTHTYTAFGVYTAVVTATNSVNTVVAQTVVTVINARPIADAGFDQGVAILAVVQLDGSGSMDPDNHLPLSYLWTQTGGPAVVLSSNSAVAPTFTAPATSAALTFTLRVTDVLGLGSSTADTVFVAVDDSPATGLSAINDSPTTLGSSTHFTALVTNSTNAVYLWNFGDGQVMNGQTISHTYSAVGIYTATVTATNGAGSVVATTLVSVTNDRPVANAGSNQSVTVGAAVSLNGSASSDADNHLPLSYGWKQIGGSAVVLTNASSATPSFNAPATPMVLTFQLVVTDAFGLADLSPATVVVTVTDVPLAGLSVINNGPVILGNAIQFTAAVTAGSNVVYTWNFGDGQTGSGPNPIYTYLTTGTFNVVVTATNSVNGSSATTVATVTASSALNGRLTADVGPTLITYTLVVTNAHASFPVMGVIVSGSVPAQAQLVSFTNAISSTTGGDYGNGFVRNPAPVTLSAGQSITITWTVKPNPGTRTVVTRGHARGVEGSLDLTVSSPIYGVFLPVLLNAYQAP